MSEREWDKFVELLERVVNLESRFSGMSWQEKAEEVRRAFVSRGAETQLEEFASWF